MRRKRRYLGTLLAATLAFATVISAAFIGAPMKAQAVCSGTHEGAYGFYYSRGSKDAMAVLDWGEGTEGSTHKGGANDTTRLDLMLKSLDLLDECNNLRAQHGLAPLYVTDYMMAVAQVQLNWSDTNGKHSKFYNVGENLAWGYNDPFEGWYTAEKQQYDAGNRTSSKVGHYLNIINSEYTVAGFAVSVENSGRYNISYGQTFTYSDKSGQTPETVAQYRAELSNYINAGGINPSTLIEAPSGAQDDLSPQVMYRLYNPNSGEHFFTANAAERDSLAAIGWGYEGTAWTAPTRTGVPVYRMYNKNVGDHHYTLNAAEAINLLNAGWSYEGIGWYSDPDGHVPVYRLYSPAATGAGSHHYTMQPGEAQILSQNGWNFEGEAWWGL